MDIIGFLIVGALAGWIAGLLLQDSGQGLLRNLLVGVIGAFIGGTLFQQLGISIGQGLIGSLVMAVIGAVLLLFVIQLMRKLISNK